MHQIRQILDFKLRGYPIKKIVRLSNTARNTVREYLRKAAATEVPLNDLIALDDDALSRILQGDPSPQSSLDPRRSDFEKRQEYFAAELKRPGVTKQILWEEYMREYSQGYAYSQFCFHLRAYLQRSQAVMHLTYRPAEQLMAVLTSSLTTNSFQAGTGTTTVQMVKKMASLSELEQFIAMGYKEGMAIVIGNLDEYLRTTGHQQ